MTPHPKKLCQVAKLQGFKIKFDQCCFGLKSASGRLIKKPTVLMTNSPVLRRTFENNLCSGDHKHQRVQGHIHGKPVSKEAETYPPDMCRALALAVINQWAEDHPKP